MKSYGNSVGLHQ